MRCSREFRILVVSRLPALTQHPDGHAYFKMLQYVLWSTMTDRDTGRLLMPYNVVADIVGIVGIVGTVGTVGTVGKHPHDKHFRAYAWLDAFSRDVLPLNPSEYRFVDGKTRTINPDIPADIQDALRADRQVKDRKDWVWFTDGSSVSRRSLHRSIQEEEDAVVGMAQAAGKDHPAGELMDFLLTQPQDCLQRVLARNWPSVKEAVFALPGETPKQRATRKWCERVLDSLHERRTIYYRAARRSPRVYAIGSTIHCSPGGSAS